jgi:hypothetical protein
MANRPVTIMRAARVDSDPHPIMHEYEAVYLPVLMDGEPRTIYAMQCKLCGKLQSNTVLEKSE